MFNWFKKKDKEQYTEVDSKSIVIRGFPDDIAQGVYYLIYNEILRTKCADDIYIDGFRVANRLRDCYNNHPSKEVTYYIKDYELFAWNAIKDGRVIETPNVKTPCVELCNSLIDHPEDWEREIIIEVYTMMRTPPSDDEWHYKGRFVLCGGNTKNFAFSAAEVRLISHFQNKCLQLKAEAAKVAERNELTKLFKGE